MSHFFFPRYGVAHGCAQEPTLGSAVKFRGKSVRKNRSLVPRSNIAGSWTRGGGGYFGHHCCLVVGFDALGTWHFWMFTLFHPFLLFLHTFFAHFHHIYPFSRSIDMVIHFEGACY